VVVATQYRSFADSPEKEAFLTIVDLDFNPDRGLLNKDAVVARTLSGATIG
jgi:hypothetical protein